MILKAGTYRFKDTINLYDTLNIVFNFTYELNSEGLTATFYCSRMYYELNSKGLPTLYYTVPQIDMGDGIGDWGVDTLAYVVGSAGEYNEGWQQGEVGYPTKTVTIHKDVEVDDVGGNWFIASTNYNEVNAKPLAEITYNGETIAQLNAGETATLSCEGKKMASDVVVKVNKGSNGNVVPLTAKQNGTYTYTYETATETIDVNTQWEFMIPEMNDIVGFKKATNFIAPKSIEDMSSKLFYMSVPQEDGTIKSSPFDEITQEEGFVFANMVLMYVGDATPLNEEYGTTYFENNTVYLTNTIWLIWIFAGVEIEDVPPITVTFASKLIENASFYPVTVDVEPNLTTRTITTNGTYTPSEDVDGFSSVTVDVPAKVTVTKLPTGNADADDVYEMDGALYKLNTNVLTGAWTMSENPNVSAIHNSNSYEVNFTCNGVEYTGFGYKYDNIDYKLYYQGPNAIEVYNTVKGWLNDSYRYIEITGENENVLAWLHSNGSKKTSGEWVHYIAPSGSLPITENGTYSVTDKEEVVVDVPTTTDGVPVEMLNQAVMNELIAPNSTKGEVGAVYLYHGEASDTYEYGALYILEEVSE